RVVGGRGAPAPRLRDRGPRILLAAREAAPHQRLAGREPIRERLLDPRTHRLRATDAEEEPAASRLGEEAERAAQVPLVEHGLRGQGAGPSVARQESCRVSEPHRPYTLGSALPRGSTSYVPRATATHDRDARPRPRPRRTTATATATATTTATATATATA